MQYRYSIPKIDLDACEKLEKDAKIYSVTSENDNWGRKHHIKTIVVFTDGSKYITHYTHTEPGFGYTNLIVDKETIRPIYVECEEILKIMVTSRKNSAPKKNK